MSATHRTVVSGLIVTAMALVALVPATTATAATADLLVTLDVSPTSGLGPGGNVTYTATVSNGGPDAATSVSLVVTLPSGVIPISVMPDGPCAFNAAGTAVNCSLGTIANGAASAATIVVHPITVGMKTATANATAAEADPTPGDNTHTASSTLTESASATQPSRWPTRPTRTRWAGSWSMSPPSRTSRMTPRPTSWSPFRCRAPCSSSPPRRNGGHAPWWAGP